MAARRRSQLPSSAALFVLLLPCLVEIFSITDNVSVNGFPIPRKQDLESKSDGEGDMLPDISPSSGLKPLIPAYAPDMSPDSAPEPEIPFVAPSPLSPFFNNSKPKFSGRCSLNFSAIDNLMDTTAVDCLSSLAPFLANVICCPQLQATLTILMGESSKETGMLTLDSSSAYYCLSDVQQLLLSKGASDNLKSICSIKLSNLTEGSCPVNDVNALESIVDSSKLLAACRKVDPVNECCSQICQNAINEAAQKISATDSSLEKYTPIQLSLKLDSCKNIVLRWLSSRLDPSSSKELLRHISNCNVNEACPLIFPGTRNIAKACGMTSKNDTLCCKAMDSYISHLQKQSFITNLQALDCAASLGIKLQKMNVSRNIYSLCQVSLKDFSLQVGSQESGCLLPSMPSDVTFDPASGISFTCDLNDNIAAPWPTMLQVPVSTCNKSVSFPELPAATSMHSGIRQQSGFDFSLLILLLFGILHALSQIQV